MFSLGLTGTIHGFDPLMLLLIAMIIDGYLGDDGPLFRYVRHPVALLGAVIGALDRKLNRENRSEIDRAIRGLLAVLVMAAGSGVIGWAVTWLSRNHDFGWIVELLLVVFLLAQRGLYDAVGGVAQALGTGGLAAGRQAVSHIVGRDPEQLDAHGVSRAAIETLAENFCDGVVAPVFWYVILGFPGLLIAKAVNTMDSMIGHRTPRYRAFGMAAARLDDLVNWIPARLSGLFLAVAAIVTPTASPWRAVKIMLRDAGKHRSVNAGWPEAAAAGALNLALAGPRRYRQQVVDDPWLGDGDARAEPRDILRALYLYVAACLVNAAVVAAVAVWRLSVL